ncbi:peptidoglycan-binding domain-containing protein [Nonomuraea fuscirosea]|uniref:peptidoglycan-binding domain-containing protein n=1 Tax=Nonomuraea fuscirosea TaxID=1291556 RepID=UPI00343A7566
MGDQLVLLGLGFVLTTVLGGMLGYLFQRRAWAHQYKTQQHEREREQASKIFEEVSSLLDRRLYRMRLVFWAAKRRAVGGAADGLAEAREGYREVLLTWNDNLNRSSALTQAYFGSGARQRLEELYEDYAAIGRALDQFMRDLGGASAREKDESVRESSAGSRRAVRIPPIGHRLDQLSHQVYLLNLHMLRLLQSGQLGQAAPTEPIFSPRRLLLLQFGDQGAAVRRLQSALGRSGETPIAVDGLFGRATERALRAFQEAHGLVADGRYGFATRKALPIGEDLPLLREGAKGDIVGRLQSVLMEYASNRWETTPGSVDGMFGPATARAVEAFQEWRGLLIDGVVGPNTWAARLSDDGPSLESAVGTSLVSGQATRTE